MKLISVLAASVAALVVVAPAQAAVTFTLSGVTFTDGTSASGSFTTNDDFTSVTDFSISTQDGTFTGPFGIGFDVAIDGFTFAPADATASITSTSVSFAQPQFVIFGRGLELNFDLLAEGVTALTGGGEYEFIVGRGITAGQLIGVTVPGGPSGAVPEPATWAMMIGGIGAAGGALRRRRQKVRTAIRFA